MLINSIEECCKALRFSKNLVDNSKTFKADTHEEYLLGLLKMELKYREELRKERLIKNAGFYNRKHFNTFRFDDVSLPSGINQEYLRDCKFVEEKKNLVFFGNTGSGKTHLAQALGLEACNQGKQVSFFRTAALVNKLSEAKNEKTLSTLLKKILKSELLILDEWGYVPLDRDGARLLFEIISECYETKSIIVTTNIEFSRWSNILYDEQMTSALLDRLLHHCYLLIFNGDSDRMKNSLIRLT
jgi:DNA replication protein DnaC